MPTPLADGNAPAEGWADLSAQSDALAASVAEAAHTLDGLPEAGSAYVVTSLLAACVHVAAERDDASFLAFDEVLPALPGLVEQHPDIEDRVLAAIG
ncbi:MAG: hypothetical protein R3B72_38975 [Polyangiaceae bacterium]